MQFALQAENEELISSQFNDFLNDWDHRYQSVVSKNPLFDNKITASWTSQQKQLLVGYLYHIRGHFHDLLWEMGTSAPSSEYKEMIITNIRDEFGGRGLSHEHMYFLFARHFNIELQNELVENRYYADFIREYQKTVLLWFKQQTWDKKLAAFAAVERLDNIDYANLLSLARSLGQLAPKQEAFFIIHINVAHFSEAIKASLLTTWKKSRAIIEESFAIVLDIQTAMWQDLYTNVHSQRKYYDFGSLSKKAESTH